MKNSIKLTLRKIVPEPLLKLYRSALVRNKKKGHIFKNLDAKTVFYKIYKSNHWKHGESFSGPGSTVENTTDVRANIEEIITKYHIQSILDLPCGDFNWMHLVDFYGAFYTGADIVNELIETNNKKYASETIAFKCINLLADPLPTVDLIICRDCLVHLSNSDIQTALKNIKKSNSTYLLTTTFNKHGENEDIFTGGWRPINLAAPPFNLVNAKSIFNESSVNHSQFKDKSLALYEIANLRI